MMKWLEFRQNRTTTQSHKSAPPDYFQSAMSWSDDLHAQVLVSRNRYQKAFLLSMALASLLVICLLVLLPLQHTQLVIVHEGAAGYVWLSTQKSGQTVPINILRTKAEIAHYVITRQSYDPQLYREQGRQVGILSSNIVFSQYQRQQFSNNSLSPAHLLKNRGYRRVTVNSVLILSHTSRHGRNHHAHLAQVDFVVKDYFFGQNKPIRTIPFTALVSWQYLGVPHNPTNMLFDWDGFVVTRYVVNPVNTGAVASAMN